MSLFILGFPLAKEPNMPISFTPYSCFNNFLLDFIARFICISFIILPPYYNAVVIFFFNLFIFERSEKMKAQKSPIFAVFIFSLKNTPEKAHPLLEAFLPCFSFEIQQ